VKDVRRAPAWTIWVLAAAVLALDWFTKKWALHTLIHSDSRAIIGDFLQLTYTRNTGVAFGLFAGRDLPLSWLSVVALVVVVWLALRPSARAWPRTIALGLILGGALGNLIDRVRWGSVIDFIDVGIGTLRWPVFNFADAAITTGVLLWSAQLLFSRPRSRVAPVDAVPDPRAADDARGP
jgi:signal peptidase II